MKKNKKLAIAALISLAALSAGASLGSSGINPAETLGVIWAKLRGLPVKTDPRLAAIIWELRLPRTILAFLTGGSLAVSGMVFQSVLKNQLASPYILGISSGASLGAALVMICGLTLGGFALPLVGFVFGLGTVFIVIALAARLDRSLSNNTIILFGMVFSLFVNAILVTLLSLFREELKNLLVWQLGSFALRGWAHVRLLLPFLVVGMGGILMCTRELDILSFGEDEGRSMGVDAAPVRKRLFFFSALLTGAAVALSGAIGFVDLIAPHAARRITGSGHRHGIPLAFLLGGILMAASDLAARFFISPAELPVGAITALIGAPFFAWVYFRRSGTQSGGSG
ncbi:corrinoid ABC transporter permease [Spirochaetia bacterium]|nr:corrinoid ABC transporter permease [Spirochaetia bacterium]